MARTLDLRQVARPPVSLAAKRRAEQRSRRWVLRQLDKLDQHRDRQDGVG
jgi:hypothetical protein